MRWCEVSMNINLDAQCRVITNALVESGRFFNFFFCFFVYFAQFQEESKIIV